MAILAKTVPKDGVTVKNTMTHLLERRMKQRIWGPTSWKNWPMTVPVGVINAAYDSQANAKVPRVAPVKANDNNAPSSSTILNFCYTVAFFLFSLVA